MKIKWQFNPKKSTKRLINNWDHACICWHRSFYSYVRFISTFLHLVLHRKCWSTCSKRELCFPSFIVNMLESVPISASCPYGKMCDHTLNVCVWFVIPPIQVWSERLTTTRTWIIICSPRWHPYPSSLLNSCEIYIQFAGYKLIDMWLDHSDNLFTSVCWWAS